MRKEVIKFLVLLMVALGAGPVGAAVWQWSTTAGTNATADPSINWSEGMSPSSVNDSARAMMARLADYRNDLGGLTSTGGSATAYTLTSNQGGFTPTADRDKFTVGFTMHATNTGTATLNVDGGGAKPLRNVSGSGMNAGVLVQGSVYLATYKNSTDEWLVHNIRGVAAEVPIGAIIDYTVGTSPSANYIIPSGQCISRTTYATYFALVGTAYGACDGVTTFAVIDLRGRVTASHDLGSNRLLGCSPTAGCGSQSVVLAANQMPLHNHSVNIVTSTESVAHDHAIITPTSRTSGATVGPTAIFWSGEVVANTATENQLHTHSVIGNTGDTGGAAQVSVLQPTITIQKLLRVL